MTPYQRSQLLRAANKLGSAHGASLGLITMWEREVGELDDDFRNQILGAFSEASRILEEVIGDEGSDPLPTRESVGYAG